MYAVKAETQSRESLVTRMAHARRQTDRLFELIRADSLYERPITERHRIVFYIGHLEAFDWNLLQPSLPGLKPFDASLDRLFAFGIDPVDGGLPTDVPADWPALPQVHHYRNRIRESLDSAIERTEFEDNLLLNVSVEHRLMHAETLAYMLHQLPLDRKLSESQVAVAAPGTWQPETINVPAGRITLGLAREDAASFGWDNEYEAHVVSVPAFAIDRYKVTNGQYLEFVQDGGYQDRAPWSDADWAWRTEHDIRHPLFWKQTGGEWYYRGMFEEIPLPPDWPVYVSHAEASAYARWIAKRLPTEAEWQRAAYGTASRHGTSKDERQYPWGSEAPAEQHGYLDFKRWDPVAVNAYPRGRSGFGLDGMLANGWEWTSSVFQPFEGFQAFPFYPGYSANFFDGRHYVMKGSSARTDRSMLRRSFRNWFQPHYQQVYAGFRCVSE